MPVCRVRRVTRGPGVVVCDGQLEDFGEYIRFSVAEALLLMPLAYTSTGVLAAESSCLNPTVTSLNLGVA